MFTCSIPTHLTVRTPRLPPRRALSLGRSFLGTVRRRSGSHTRSLIQLSRLGSVVLSAIMTFLVAAAPGSFAPPLVVFVVAFCLFCLLVALAISRAKRDVSIDFTMLEIRK